MLLFFSKTPLEQKFWHVFFLLLLQEVPEIPGNFDLVGHSSRQANLSWSLPYDGQSPLLAFHLEFQRTDAGKKKVSQVQFYHKTAYLSVFHGVENSMHENLLSPFLTKIS